jgi:cytochrome P450
VFAALHTRVVDRQVEVDVASSSVAPSPRAELRRWEDLPGPRGWPWVGNVGQIRPSRLHAIYEAWAREFGPIYRLEFFGRPALVLSDHAMVQAALRARPQSFSRNRMVASVFGEMGATGVFSSEGGAWRHQRRLAMETLGTRHTRGFFSDTIAGRGALAAALGARGGERRSD